MNLTRKVKLLPTPEQSKLLENTIERFNWPYEYEYWQKGRGLMSA
jgi:hypothetical protein